MKNNNGFTLVEILVAVVILSTALLGLVGLQTAGLKNTVSSYNRTQATQLAYAIADRIRANRVEAALGDNSIYTTIDPTNANANPDCSTTTGCTTADMAENDLFEWNQELKDITKGLPKTGKIEACASPHIPPACIAPVPGNPFVFAITVSWGEGRDENKDGIIDDDLSFQTDFQL